MTLIVGLTIVKSDEGPDWKRTLALEERGREIVRLVQQFGASPDAAAHESAHRLLVDIEAWKGMCMRERMVNAIQSPPAFVWAAFYGAVIANTDVAKICAIMGLKGFGASVDEETGMRRAKVASSVLRSLYSDEWGVVDWRTLGIRDALRRCGGDIARMKEYLALRGPIPSAAAGTPLFSTIGTAHAVCAAGTSFCAQHQQRRARNHLSIVPG